MDPGKCDDSGRIEWLHRVRSRQAPIYWNRIARWGSGCLVENTALGVVSAMTIKRIAQPSCRRLSDIASLAPLFVDDVEWWSTDRSLSKGSVLVLLEGEQVSCVLPAHAARNRDDFSPQGGDTCGALEYGLGVEISAFIRCFGRGVFDIVINVHG